VLAISQPSLIPMRSTSKHFQALQDCARAHGIGLELRMAATSEEITPAIDAAKASAVAGVNVLSSPLLFANRRIIFERAAAVGLPAMYQSPEEIELILNLKTAKALGLTIPQAILDRANDVIE